MLRMSLAVCFKFFLRKLLVLLILKEVSPDEKYNMVISVAECAVIVTSTTEPKASVKIVLTSPMVREEEEDESVDKKDAQNVTAIKKGMIF